MIIEIAAIKALGLDYEKGHIVFGSLQFKAKSSILRTLLKRSDPPNENGITSLHKLVQFARRNALVHSIVVASSTKPLLEFYKRDVDSDIKVKKMYFNDDEMSGHIGTLIELQSEIEKQLNVTREDIQEYLSTLTAL